MHKRKGYDKILSAWGCRLDFNLSKLWTLGQCNHRISKLRLCLFIFKSSQPTIKLFLTFKKPRYKTFMQYASKMFQITSEQIFPDFINFWILLKYDG